LLQEMQSAGRAWFWKDPRLSVLLPFWKQFWGPAIYGFLAVWRGKRREEEV
jgi:hypothetical protein